MRVRIACVSQRAAWSTGMVKLVPRQKNPWDSISSQNKQLKLEKQTCEPDCISQCGTMWAKSQRPPGNGMR